MLSKSFSAIVNFSFVDCNVPFNSIDFTGYVVLAEFLAKITHDGILNSGLTFFKS